MNEQNTNKSMVAKLVERKLHTILDILLMNRYMREYQKIINKNNEIIKEKKIFYKNQRINYLKSAKVIILLDLIEFINKNVLATTKEEIKIAIDNFRLFKGLNKDWEKVSEYGNNTRVPITKIKEIINKVRCRILLILIIKCKNKIF